MIYSLQDNIFRIKDSTQLLSAAIEIFKWQASNNKVYNDFIEGLGWKRGTIGRVDEIPFLPIEFFRNHRIVSSAEPVEMIFESSSTTGAVPSKHFVVDLSLYEESFLKGFSLFYGNPEEYLFCALLPSYTERENSSLAYMTDRLIKRSNNSVSGFYKDNPEELIKVILDAKLSGQKIILLGVSFALLDLAESHSADFSDVIVMETGGMKGRRKELIRSELHAILKEKLSLSSVHSEYGMTELLSQSYSKGDGIFYSPPWMKVLIRDPMDPLHIYSETRKTGGINIIDLANINSCSFIATNDLGILHDDGGFEVLGRFDNSDIRGCNLMVQ